MRTSSSSLGCESAWTTGERLLVAALLAALAFFLVRFIALSLLLPPAALAAETGTSWHEPVNLGPTVNSSADDWYPVLARDGSFMIFVSNRAGGLGDSDLWISRRVEGQWQTPENLGATVNTFGTESAPFLANGDSTLYFLSTSTGGGDIYTCPLVDGVPGTRSKLGYPINTAWIDCCPVLSRDGSLLYICSNRPGTYGADDVWVSQRSGTSWSTPVNLGPAVNTAGNDCPRWISDDGATLLVCSDRTDGLGGADIWVTENDGGTWSAPVNPGAPLNSGAPEWGAWPSAGDGTLRGTIHIGSGRGGGYGGWDLWTASEDLTAAPEPSGDPAGDGLRLSARPNPASAGTVLSYRLSETTRVTIDIHDVGGRRIRRLLDAEQGPGDHTVRWDPRGDDAGRAFAGVRYCRLQAGRAQAFRRIVVLR
jgi:hypothetical protein